MNKDKIIDISFKQFGRWIALYHAGSAKGRRALWHCICECGNEADVNSSDLRRGHSTSCGCYNRDQIRLRSAKKDSGKNKLLRQYKKSASLRGFSYTLSVEEFTNLTQSPCHYCGIPPSRISKKSSDFGVYIYNGIDRKDNTLGYDFNNCVSCCYECNLFKHSMPYEDFISIIKKIYINLKGNIE